MTKHIFIYIYKYKCTRYAKQNNLDYFMFKSSIAAYEEIMPRENTVHTDKHQTKQPKGIVIVLYFLVLFVLLIKVF